MSKNQLARNKTKPVSREQQFMYLGRWVDKSTFRAFVYDAQGNQKLANNYNDYERLTGSGEWFAVKPEPKALPPVPAAKPVPAPTRTVRNQQPIQQPTLTAACEEKPNDAVLADR
jgi:hypothetical protein